MSTPAEVFAAWLDSDSVSENRAADEVRERADEVNALIAERDRATPDEPTERDMEASPCHPYDEKCGGPGGPCRSHGGTFPVEKNRREQAERDAEALTNADLGSIHDAAQRCVLTFDPLRVVVERILAERIAEAEKRGAARAYRLVIARIDALRGDA